MRIALAQITSGPDPLANLELIARNTAVAAARGADVVVFPEATMCAFGNPLGPIAEPTDGPWANRVREIAAEWSMVIVVGMFTPAGDKVRNTALVTGRGLELAYDKIHLFDAYGFAESATVEAGDALVTFDLDGLGVGIATCYDLRFPEQFLALARAGADVVLVPTSWGAGEGKAEALGLLARARALDMTSYVVVCDQADPASQGLPVGSSPTGVGHSLAVGPGGAVLVQAGDEPELLTVTVDAEEVAAVRRTLPVLANARSMEALLSPTRQ